MIEETLEEAQLKDIAEEVAKYAIANPVFSIKRVYEALESRPEGVSMAQALCMMMNQAHAMGYITAKKERRIIIAGRPN